MIVKKIYFVVVFFLLTSCSLFPHKIDSKKKLTTDIPPIVLLFASFISPIPYDDQNESATPISKDISHEEEIIKLVNYEDLSQNQRDIILFSFQFLNKRINRKEVILSMDDNSSVKEIKEMMENNRRAVDLSNNKVKRQWSMIVNRLKEIKGFENQNPKIFLLSNKNKVRAIFVKTFNIQRAGNSRRS